MIPETRKTVIYMSTMNSDVSFIERCSSLSRLLCIIAYCLSFGRQKGRIAGFVQTSEIVKVTQCVRVLRLVQAQYWAEEIPNLKIGKKSILRMYKLF